MTQQRHQVATTDDFPSNGSRILAEIDGHEVAVFRIDGDYHAVANFCVHQGGPLCEGELTGRITVQDDDWMWGYDDSEHCIVCPWHGWKFDITNGENVNDSRYRVPKYKTEIEDGDVYVYW